ncbi:hypothetical protein KKG71_03940 [Patescibacteria group bacterium]|nr:hypothetical protein [Patescibacteria group bacterium]
MTEKDFSQLKLQVEKLISTGEIKVAIEKCRDYLQFDNSDAVISLIEQLEKLDKDTTIQIIDQAIKKSDHLWNERQYMKLYNLYMRLYSMAPKYKKLENLIVKVRNVIEKNEHAQIKDVATTAESKIRELLGRGVYKDVYLACNELLEIDHTNSFALKTMKQAEKKYFNQLALDAKNKYVDKGDFRGAIDEFSSLINKFGNNKILLNALVESDQKLINQVKSGHEESINAGLDKVGELVAKKAYSDAMLAILKLQEIDPTHKKIQKTKIKIQLKLDQLLDEEIVEHIKGLQPLLEEEYGKNPEGFVRV